MVGPPWHALAPGDPADDVTLDDQVSLALLTVLETLSPAERAVYVLHEAFAVPLAEVAGIVGRSEAACRQLAVRARRHVQERAPRFDPDQSERARVVAAFQAACESGDLDGLARARRRRRAAHGRRRGGDGRRPAGGRPRPGGAGGGGGPAGATRAGAGAAHGQRPPGPGGTFDGEPVVLAFVVDGGRIARIDAVANPDKLRRVGPPH